MVLEEQIAEHQLTALDRCDAEDCPSQAYIKAIGVSGELLFCSHHWRAIMRSPTGKQKMDDFAYKVVDETGKLVENRLVGEN